MSPSKENLLIGPSKFPASPEIKNVLVTGGAGFIASWVVRHLTVKYPEYNVYCYDKLGYCSSIKNVSPLNAYPNFTFIQGDIIDEKHLTAVFEQYKIDTVLHLAAESHVDHSFGNPYQFTYTNVLGTQVLLEVSKKFKVRRVVHMSTDEVYGEVGKGEQDLLESSILVPTNPYAASKASSDMLISAYLHSFNLPCVVVRCNNIYGPNQFPEKIIPKFISLLSSGRKCALHGNGQHTRRYLYVADAVAAVDTVLHKGLIGCIYNAGVENELSNFEVCKKLIEAFGEDPSNPEVIEKRVEFTEDRPFNDSRYAIDSRRIHQLGWRPLTDFDKGIKTTVEWYLEHGQDWWGEDMDQYLQPHPATKFEQPNLIP